MPLRNTVKTYGWLAKSFHWIMAVLIFGMIAVGFIMDRMALSPQKIELIGWHKSFGFVVLVFAVARLVWREVNVQPPLPAGMPAWQKWGAHLSHFGLYALMIAVPMCGWLMSSAAGFTVVVFQSFELPNFIGPDRELRSLFGALHFYAAYTLLGVIVLHAAAALFHHFIRKDDILRRMLPFGKA